MSDIEYAKTSVKVINDFLIDIIGSVVPGIIFLFSVIVSVAIPAVMLYFSYPLLPEPDTQYATKVELLISNTFQGWFWLVVFFTFLILAYAIGNIFYRRDIKEMDRASFVYAKKKHFYNTVLPAVRFTNIKIRDRKATKKNARTPHAGEQDEKEFIEKYFETIYDYIPGPDKNITGIPYQRCSQKAGGT
ncbi:MAG: hypothetical protein LUD76_07800 [Alistipes sp.]|nr:hypothetical protein [Alistipes sp.]